MTLQGPHQVAKASTTTILLSFTAESNSVLLEHMSALLTGREEEDILCDIVDTHVDGSTFESSDEFI